MIDMTAQTDLVERLRAHKLSLPCAEQAADEIERLIADLEQYEALHSAAIKLKDDMILRADIGTFDGDHSVQAGATVWWVFCQALEALQDKDHDTD